METESNSRLARINESCQDFYLRISLVRLIAVIRDDFGGYVGSENKISTAMKDRYGWGNKTTGKRLDTLQSLGLITITQGNGGHKKKEFTLCDS
jgi:hypothetical protein